MLDVEGEAVVALVRVAAEDVLILTNFLTHLLARTLAGHLASIGFYFLLKMSVSSVMNSISFLSPSRIVPQDCRTPWLAPPQRWRS